jgi:hypothetical protein
LYGEFCFNLYRVVLRINDVGSFVLITANAALSYRKLHTGQRNMLKKVFRELFIKLSVAFSNRKCLICLIPKPCLVPLGGKKTFIPDNSTNREHFGALNIRGSIVVCVYFYYWLLSAGFSLETIAT